MTDCIFCKIVNGEIPCYKIYEDNDVLAFLDISQTTFGHTLLIPKEHIVDIYGYNDVLAQKVLTKIPMISKLLKSSLPDIKGLNIVNNNGKLAGQAVFHSHFHFIPRYSKNNTFKINFTDNSSKYSSDELTKLANTISEHSNSENQ